MPSATPLLAADPARIGRYRLTGRIGGLPGDGPRMDGGTGAANRRDGPAPFVVYLGRATDGEWVTVTLLQPVPADDSAARDRFTAEAAAARQVAPFCVARVVDAGFHGEFPYLVSEHIAGQSLAEVVHEEGPLSDELLGAVAIGAATGLASIHQAGLVHGHLGPQQIILGVDGPRVVHSGITPPYGLATPAADVLAWAHAVLFAVTGKPRRALDDPDSQDLRLLTSPLRELVTESLARDPAARPPAKVIVTRLLGHVQPPAGILAAGTRTAVGAHTAVHAPAGSDRRAMPRQARLSFGRASVAAAIAAAVVTAAVTITAVFTFGHHGTPPDASSGEQVTSSPRSHPVTLPPSPPPSSPAGEPIPGSLSGTWTGLLKQDSPPLKIAAQIRLSAGARSGTVAYPSFGCSGVLVLTKQAHARFVFRQGIVSGQQTCGQGTVILTPHGTALGFAFTAATPGGPGIQGTLSRS
ncbi:MAG: serine/threonine protein kinase [Micromonosporaceae bacterium]